MGRTSLVDNPVYGGWQNIEAAWPLIALLFYKTSPATAQSLDFLSDSQYISYGLSHFTKGLPLLLAENVQTPLDSHTNYFSLPPPTPRGSLFSGFLGREDSRKKQAFNPNCPGPKLGSVTC